MGFGTNRKVTPDQRTEAAKLCYRYRRANDLSQRDMAKQLGGKATHVYVSDLESESIRCPAWAILKALEICQPENDRG